MIADIDEILAMWEMEYRRHADAGGKHTTAKKKASAEVRRAYNLDAAFKAAMMYRLNGGPITEDVMLGKKITSSMGHLGAKLRREYRALSNGSESMPPAAVASTIRLTLPPDDSGNGTGARQRRKPGLIVHESGNSNVTDTLLSALKTLSLKPGDTLCLGDMYFWSPIVGCTPAAIPNSIQSLAGVKAFKNAGYQFEVVDKSYRSFSVRVVAVPMTANEREAHELRAQVAALLARLDKLEGK